ncbi:MAG: hypothetical protein ACE5KA_02165 [Nitrososphaerales archaeon]
MLIRLRRQLVLADTLWDRNVAKYAKYFSSGRACGVLVAVID